MVSLIKYGGHQNKNDMNFVGKSTDTKPIKTFDGMPISNGSTFYEMDTETEYMSSTLLWIVHCVRFLITAAV